MFLKSDADGFVSRPPNTVYMKRVIYVVYNLRMTHQNVTNPTQTAGSATKMSWVRGSTIREGGDTTISSPGRS